MSDVSQRALVTLRCGHGLYCRWRDADLERFTD